MSNISVFGRKILKLIFLILGIMFIIIQNTIGYRCAEVIKTFA